MTTNNLENGILNYLKSQGLDADAAKEIASVVQHQLKTEKPSKADFVEFKNDLHARLEQHFNLLNKRVARRFWKVGGVLLISILISVAYLRISLGQ